MRGKHSSDVRTLRGASVNARGRLRSRRNRTGSPAADKPYFSSQIRLNSW
jgi:hypothetical protein